MIKHRRSLFLLLLPALLLIGPACTQTRTVDDGFGVRFQEVNSSERVKID